MPNVIQLGEGVSALDVEFQGRPEVIAVYLVEDQGERALIEIGPTSTLPALLGGLESIGVDPGSITKILLTHIHLDHAGAAGTFIRQFPQAHLYVHEIGAPHMLDPTRLLSSATRIYGDMMDSLWGAFEPVPKENLTAIGDGAIITVGSRTLEALYTPGHASHHVTFHDRMNRVVFAGDVAAVRVPRLDYVRPPTPPPDLDLDLWEASLDRVEGLDPRVLYLTHFGAVDDISPHLAQLRVRLRAWESVIQKAMESGQDRLELVDTLRLYADREILEITNDAAALDRLELATPYGMTVDGYLRYFKMKERRAS